MEQKADQILIAHQVLALFQSLILWGGLNLTGAFIIQYVFSFNLILLMLIRDLVIPYISASIILSISDMWLKGATVKFVCIGFGIILLAVLVFIYASLFSFPENGELIEYIAYFFAGGIPTAGILGAVLTYRRVRIVDL